MSLVIELKRKAIHLTSGLVPLSYAFWGSKRVVVALLAVACAVMLFVEAIRHRDNWAGRTFRKLFNNMLREKELNQAETKRGPRWVGATHYCLGCLLCVVLFPKPIAVLSLLFLAVGDSAASFVGKLWGRTKIGGKSLEGTAAFFISCSIVAVVAHGLSPEYPLVAAIAGALVAALAELLLKAIDDNFSIPLSAGLTMMLIQWVVESGG